MSETLERLAAAALPPQLRPGWRIEPIVPTQRAARVAVLIPCFNEEASIGQVVTDFRAALPQAAIYVYDNNSTDRTALEARAAGAVVAAETLQGKGHVVRRMFADIEADVFFLVDGDDTYDASAAPAMLQLLCGKQLDMVTAIRVDEDPAAYRRCHRLGNRLLTGMVRALFGRRASDILSGYRAFSRRFVKSFPALASGFETETEFTIHALELCMPMGEVRAQYRMRRAGSQSKLRTLHDGLRILRTIALLLKEQRPFEFFSAIAVFLFIGALLIASPLLPEYLRTGLVPRLPTVVLATGFALLACIAFACGIILDSVARGRKEMKRIAYLAASQPPMFHV